MAMQRWVMRGRRSGKSDQVPRVLWPLREDKGLIHRCKYNLRSLQKGLWWESQANSQCQRSTKGKRRGTEVGKPSSLEEYCYMFVKYFNFFSCKEKIFPTVYLFSL